ncbi:MAG TPA: endonuclease/exonuclease/phosphatase family protein [Thermohalobaculum sp.]|nr:endonuclease/exonuclease/phosphatase family protein [Thermohalobaculum sp.]
MARKLIFLLSGLLFAGIAAGYGAEWHPLLAAAADFRLHLAVLAGGLGVVASIFVLRGAAVLAFLSAAIAASGLGPIFEPAERPGEGRAVTVLYANLWDRNPDPIAMRAALIAADADILITSETMRSVTDGAGGLRSHYPYRLTSLSPGPVLRTAIWSKFPLRQTKLYPNNTIAPTGAAATAELGRGARLGVIGGHFSRAGEGLQKAQADGLADMAAPLARPLLVAADFNAAPWSWVVRRAEAVTRTRILGGHRITWKGQYPTPLGPVPAPWGHQIDHVLLSEGVGVGEVSTIRLPGSDHRGVWVQLLIPAQ